MYCLVERYDSLCERNEDDTWQGESVSDTPVVIIIVMHSILCFPVRKLHKDCIPSQDKVRNELGMFQGSIFCLDPCLG